jgi:hypothetical protein
MMSQRLSAAIVVGAVFACPSVLWAGRPIIVTVTHEAVFQNLGDYPNSVFYLAAGRGWLPVQSGVATQINLNGWEKASLRLCMQFPGILSTRTATGRRGRGQLLARDRGKPSRQMVTVVILRAAQAWADTAEEVESSVRTIQPRQGRGELS